MLEDYFKIQDKIKLLEEKVENIKTSYYNESEKKSECIFDHNDNKENKP